MISASAWRCGAQSCFFSSGSVSVSLVCLFGGTPLLGATGGLNLRSRNVQRHLLLPDCWKLVQVSQACGEVGCCRQVRCDRHPGPWLGGGSACWLGGKWRVYSSL